VTDNKLTIADIDYFHDEIIKLGDIQEQILREKHKDYLEICKESDYKPVHITYSCGNNIKEGFLTFKTLDHGRVIEINFNGKLLTGYFCYTPYPFLFPVEERKDTCLISVIHKSLSSRLGLKSRISNRDLMQLLITIHSARRTEILKMIKVDFDVDISLSDDELIDSWHKNKLQRI